MIDVGIVGAAGYTGIELVRLLSAHPHFNLKVASSDSFAGKRIDEEYPALLGATNLCFSSHDDPALYDCNLVFLAVPHTAAMKSAALLVEHGVNVVDLSADFRLKDPSVYEAWYKTPHTQTDLLKRAAFGLPEITRKELLDAHIAHEEGEAVLVACAGCYPTASSLAAAPAIKAGWWQEKCGIIIDAISGVSGAGKSATHRTHFCSAYNNVEAYGLVTHRHTPEIEQILSNFKNVSGKVVFNPHLAPLNRGLLATANIPINKEVSVSSEEISKVYEDFYKDSKFVKVLPYGQLPKTSSVCGTNYAHIGFAYHKAAGTLISVCAIDNLGKGASAQAVQCANIVYGFEETAGLTQSAAAF